MKDLDFLQQQMLDFLRKSPIHKYNPQFVHKRLIPMASEAYLLAKERGLDCENVFYATIFRHIRKIENSEEKVACIDYLEKYKILDKLGIKNQDKIYEILWANTQFLDDPNATCITDANLAVEFEYLSKKINSKGHENFVTISKTLLDRYINLKKLLSCSTQEYKNIYQQKIELLDKIVSQKSVDNQKNNAKLKTYLIVLKGGHVGKGKYYPLQVIKHASTKKDAVLSALATGRVKRDDPRVVLSIKEVSYITGKKIAKRNEHDPYLKANGRVSRKAIMPIIERKICVDPYYKPLKISKNSETIRESRTYTEIYGIRNKKKFSKFHDEPAFDVTEEEINEAMKQGLS